MKNNKVLKVLVRSLFIFLTVFWFLSFMIQAQCNRLHVFNIQNTQELQEFFRYTPDFIPFISAHRGGIVRGFPENSIPAFENTLCYVHAILEMDIRLTLDGEMVLMHDVTIDRTTTGSGRVSDFTLAELREFYLKDHEGNLTNYKIPTLDEVLKWVRGKTILLLHNQDVPEEDIVNKVIEHDALHRVIFMAGRNRAIRYHELAPEAVMQVFAPDKEALYSLMNTGIPTRNMVVFIRHDRPEDGAIYSLVNQQGMMNIIGVYRIFDRQFREGEQRIFEDLIEEGANILETNMPIDVGLRIKRLRPEKSSKDRFFGMMELTIPRPLLNH